MSFQYNENACTVIIDFFKKRIEFIKNDLQFLRKEQGLTKELAVHYAIAEVINRLEFDKSAAELKIKEMEDRLRDA